MSKRAMKNNLIDRMLIFFDTLPGPVIMGAGVLGVVLIGILDYSTGYEISVSVLYLLPIMMVAWLRGRGPAAALSILSALVMLFADVFAGHVYSQVAVPIYNTVMGLWVFLLVGFSFAAIKKLMLREREHAQTDYLTGVANARSFYEQMQMEVARSARYGSPPITVVYLDVDDFKHINDTLGHLAGDKLLQAAARTIKATLRSTDFIARLGGDEFAFFMPETNAEQAGIVIRKVQERLQQVMDDHGWPVTFSLGIVTCSDPACTMDNLIKAADELMYAAKKSGKNMARFKTVTA